MSRIIKKGKTALASSILNILGLTAAFAALYIILVQVCFVIAVPVSIVIMNRYLEDFAYRVPLHIWVFALAIVAVLGITILVVTLRSLRAATMNPVKSLRTE